VKLSEDEVRRITLDTITELGENATPELVKQKVKEKIEKLSEGSVSFPIGSTSSGRVILTAFGLNKPGIVAAITKSIAESNCDIQDLSQKLMGDFFTMIMIVDLSTSPKDLKGLQKDMAKIAEELKIKIYLQHEDVFKFMHRI